MKIIKPAIFLFFLAVAFCIAENVDAAVIQRAPNNLGLVGYWSFNEGTSTKATDMSGHGNTGTLNGANGLPTWTGGRLGGALNFDGVDDYVDIAPTAVTALTQGTISAWIYPTGDVYSFIVCLSDKDVVATFAGMAFEATPDYGVYLKTAAWYGRNGATQYIMAVSAGGSVPRNKWTHIVVTVDGSGNSMYLNGAKITPTYNKGTASVTSFFSTVSDPDTFRIGMLNISTTDTFYKGLIDEVRIYNRALTAAEVATLYKAGLVQYQPSAQNKKLTSGLVGLWSFNGADMDWASTTAEALDRSGQNNNGDVNGARAVSGISGQALNFDGVDDYVSASASGVNTSAGQYNTVSFWMYDTGTADTQLPFQWTGVGYGLILLYPTDERYFGFNTLNGEVYGIAGLPRNSWVHVVAVFYNGNPSSGSQLYINGVQQSLSYVWGASSNTQNVTAPFRVGTDSTNSWPYRGKIDEVRVYNRALSASEILDLYNIGAARLKPGSSLVKKYTDSSLVGNWTFNGPDVSNAANLAYDRSGNNNNGTMVNMATTTRYVSGISGQTLKFDGVDDYVDAGSASSLDDLQTWTVSAWVYLKSLPATGKWESIVAKADISQNESYQLYIQNDGGNIYLGTYAGGTIDKQAKSSYGILSLNQWTHLVGVLDKTTTDLPKLYLNGVETGYSSRTDGNGNRSDANNNLIIGAENYTAGSAIYFNGLIDEVRVYSRALSADEVAKLYRAGR